jgi:hypothetical protein
VTSTRSAETAEETSTLPTNGGQLSIGSLLWTAAEGGGVEDCAGRFKQLIFGSVGASGVSDVSTAERVESGDRLSEQRQLQMGYFSTSSWHTYLSR